MNSALHDESARADILRRLRRAEGQLRGIQRMVEEGSACMDIAQQFSAVRKALDSTYVRMTMCILEQELENRLDKRQQETQLSPLMKDMQKLLSRMA